MKKYCLFSVILTLLCACSSDDPISGSEDKPGEQKTINLTVDGNLRSFIVYLPAGYNNAGLMPLIFVIHGGSGTPEGMLRLADFRDIADRDDVVLVYPAGIQKSWNDGRPTTANELGIDDVSFFDKLIDYMVASYSVDESMVYATGISNGGFMTSRLGCQLSNRIAAIAVVAATMDAEIIAPACNPENPVPAIYIHGTADPLVPFTGGEMTANGTAGGTILSHFQVIDKWVRLNKCNTTPLITDLYDLVNDGTTVKQRTYAAGTNGSEVVSYVVLNGGHTWPQGDQYLSELIIGKTNQDMNAGEVIRQFFKRYKRL